MSDTPSGSSGSDEGDIAFTDVVLNTFAIFLIFLVVFQLSLAISENSAPTRNREETAFLNIRDCYISALRPASQFIRVSNKGLAVIDYDKAALALAANGNSSAEIEDGTVRIEAPQPLIDANQFESTLLFKRSRRNATDDPGSPAWVDAAFALLDRDVYGRGYVPYFEVPPRLVPAFAEIFHPLLAEGRSFRWRLYRGESVKRYRAATAFRTGDFCR